MFDLLDKPLHWISVRWPALLPPEKEGDLSQPGEHEVELRVEIVDRMEAIKLGIFDDAVDERLTTEERFARDLKLFKRVVHDWRKISSNGRLVPMTDKNIKLLLASPMFPVGFNTAYISALGGVVGIREKNSGGSPKGGPEDTAKAPETVSTETANGSE